MSYYCFFFKKKGSITAQTLPKDLYLGAIVDIKDKNRGGGGSEEQEYESS